MPRRKRTNNLILDEVELVEREDVALLVQDSDEPSEDDHLLSPKKSKQGRRKATKSSSDYDQQEEFDQPRMTLCGRLLACFRKAPLTGRTVPIGRPTQIKYCTNVLRNQKYSVFSFVPKVLFNQFKNFMDMFFLLMACSQFIPFLRIGLIYTYWGPLCFVTFVTMCREGFDDFRRFQRDREVNSSRYSKLTQRGKVSISSADLKVGDLVFVDKGQRVPADIILIRTTEIEGSCFLRTDQLDGETDWKKREAIHQTQKLSDSEILNLNDSSCYAEAPSKEINSFIGTLTINKVPISVNIENTMWANTVVASGTALGLVIYTGQETRASMNNSKPRSKTGKIDKELNIMIILLLVLTASLSAVMMILKGFHGQWTDSVITLFRFILLFSYLVPISLRVNLDLSKIYYSKMIDRDSRIPGSVARTTTIPEELGRICYLLSDKTGTLTQNEMVFKRLSIGTSAYGEENFSEVRKHLTTFLSDETLADPATRHRQRSATVKRLGEAVKALALCHNVTPVHEFPDNGSVVDEDAAEADQINVANLPPGTKTTYQAASPDEIALVEWTTKMGLALIERSNMSIKLKTEAGRVMSFTIMQIFPFTSEAKRMGIILRDDETNEHIFYLKGADVVMAPKVLRNDWLEEEVSELARDGFRTLVVAKKILTPEQYRDFEDQYNAAKTSTAPTRNLEVAARIEVLEREMELLCITGVEDKLQVGVRESLELLRNAGIKVWMLTGDKLETATCIAKSSGLFSKTTRVHIFQNVSDRLQAHQEFNAYNRKQDCALVISGDSLKEVLKYYERDFMEKVVSSPAVVCCRCSPEQKADVVKAIESYTKKSAAAIGDGGNDVSMIQAASVGIGIVGKEGRQASLAADFSLMQFKYVQELLLVHGRNSYKRSATLSQFVMHRGLIISTMQAIFSAVFGFVAISIYPSILMVLYATAYTSFPVFSLVLDTDLKGYLALQTPELYKELTKGRSLSYKTFLMWVLVSVYQGGIIMFVALLLFEDEFIHISAISFTSLIFTELIMVALTVRNFHILMLAAEAFALVSYIVSMFAIREVFDQAFVWSWNFLWKTVVITALSCVPLFIVQMLRNKISPPTYQKITN